MKYAKDTEIIQSRGPWAQNIAARAICPDGKVRKMKISEADTLWTCPARFTFKGKYVSGFVSFESDSGLTSDPDQFVKFTPTGKYKEAF